MNGTIAAAYGSLIISAAGTIGVPLYIRWYKTFTAQAQGERLDSQAVAAMFKEERDALAKKLQDLTRDYEAKIEALRTEYETKLAAAETRHQATVTELRAEIADLYRRLYRNSPGS